MGNRIKPTVIEYPKEQTTLEDYEEDSKVSELESKINEYEELIQAQSHHIEELEQTVKHYQPQVDTFKRMFIAKLSLSRIHITHPTRRVIISRMPSSA